MNNSRLKTDSELRVLHVVESLGGGVYTFLKNLINSENLKDFHSGILFGDRGEVGFQQLRRDFPNCDLTLWKHARREIHPYYDFMALSVARNAIKAFRPKIIHCHSSKAGALGRIANWMGRDAGQVIYSPHGLSFLRTDTVLLKRKIYRISEKILNSLGGRVVACSPSEARELEVAGIKALVIPNGVPPAPRYEPKKLSPPWKIIAVGRATAQKNPALFNRIASAFVDRKEFEFIWIGDGELIAQLSSPNIQVMGWKSQPEVLMKLQEADLYLSTSLWEGLPLSGLEAMSSGLPLLLSSCVGNVDLIQGGNGSLFENSADAIRLIGELVLRPDQLKAMGEASRRIFSQNFSLDKMTKGFGALYLNLANQ